MILFIRRFRFPFTISHIVFLLVLSISNIGYPSLSSIIQVLGGTHVFHVLPNYFIADITWLSTTFPYKEAQIKAVESQKQTQPKNYL